MAKNTMHRRTLVQLAFTVRVDRLVLRSVFLSLGFPAGILNHLAVGQLAVRFVALANLALIVPCLV